MKYKNRIELEINDLSFNIMEKDFKQLTKKHIDIIKKYDEEQSAKGNSIASRMNRIRFFMFVARTTKKEFDDITKEDINKFLIRKSKTGEKIKDTTLNWYKELLKHFFVWMGKEEIVKHLNQKPVDDFIDSKDLWTEAEIKQLIEVATNDRDKCLVAMLFDLAIERKTIPRMNIGDIEINGNVVYVTVNGKRRGNRGKRRLQCITSAPYVMKWLNNHPDKNNPNAPFFISTSWNSRGKRVAYNFAYDKLKLLANRAGIKKEIRTHLIRHSKITDLYRKGFRGVALQRYAGWVNGNMEQRYVNLAFEEIDKERESIEMGIEYEPPEVKPSELLSVICPRCKNLNTSDDNYCSKCWFPLNQQVANEELMLIEMMRNPWYRNVINSFKELQENGNQVPIDAMNPQKLAEAFQWMKETENLSQKEIEEKILIKLEKQSLEH